MLASWKTYYCLKIISNKSLESGLNNSIRLGYCLEYISTTFEMSIAMSLWTYSKIRALKRSSPIVLRKEFFMNRSDQLVLSTVLDVTNVNNNKCKILVMFGYIKVQTLLSVKVSDRSLGFYTCVFHCLRQIFNSWSNVEGNGKSSLKKVNKSLPTSLFAKWRWAGINAIAFNAFCDKLLNLMLYCWIRESRNCKYIDLLK